MISNLVLLGNKEDHRLWGNWAMGTSSLAIRERFVSDNCLLFEQLIS